MVCLYQQISLQSAKSPFQLHGSEQEHLHQIALQILPIGKSSSGKYYSLFILSPNSNFDDFFFALQIEISRHRVTKRLAFFTHLNKKPKKGKMGRLTTEKNLLTSPLPFYISFKLVTSPPHTREGRRILLGE